MAISYLRSETAAGRSAARAHRKLTGLPRRPKPWHYAVGAGLVTIGALAVVVVLFTSSSATLTLDSSALAKIGMPLGGGTVQSISVTGRNGGIIPVSVIGGTRLWPVQTQVPAHERVRITGVIKRPGWISWLTGSTQTLHLTLVTPSASLRTHFITVPHGQPLQLRFKQPVAVVAYGQPGQLRRHVLATPQSVIDVGHEAPAGTLTVEASIRRWERARPAVVSWFPAGASAASAVATPTPGSKITPTTAITLTFSKPVAKALGSSRPAVTPATAGTWTTLNSHTIRFQPTGYGYGLATPVSIGLPGGIRLVGGQSSTSASSGSWTVPAGSTVRLQQMLSLLGYLPLTFSYSGSGVALTPAAQELAAVKPPAGSFTFRWPNTPPELQAEWKAGVSGVMTQGALMAFENNEGLTTDGVAGNGVWKALMAAVIAGHKSPFGYTFVHVSEGSPETESTWHNGKTVVSGLVNTGIPAAPTATGIYPVFEHALSVTMSGTNPDGSHYSDPGVPYVSYFNGGDALHGFIRGGYGFPQSLGCVEMPYSEASQVYPYTPIGTLVDVT
jgi:peptidoglycan hydrolase-like protein with peptidoglycan-binding domain